MTREIQRRTGEFCDRFGLRLPILQAPMSGACPPALAVAVAQAGGMGANGVLLDDVERIAAWMRAFRAGSSGAVQLNTWIPDPPVDGPGLKAATDFMGRFGTPGEPGPPAPSFEEQCEAMLAARPTVVSSIMGLFGPDYVARLHAQGIAWFACATTLADALAAEQAGADVVVAQGMEAGGHRGTFDQEAASAPRWGCSRSCHGSPTTCGFLSWRPVESPTAAVWLPLWRWGRARCRSGRRCCVHRRQASTASGPPPSRDWRRRPPP